MSPRRGIRLVAASLAAALAIPALSGCGVLSDSAGSGGSSDGKLRLALNNTSASLAAVVADKKGFFKKAGLKVTTSVFTDITKIPPALGKQFDIGFGVQPMMINATAQGLPLTMVSGNEFTTVKHPEIMLVTRKDSGITSAEDLAKARLGAPTLTGNLHLGTLFWLKKNGVDPESVNSVQVATPTMIDQLKAGKIDVAEMQQPFINLAKSKGLTTVDYPLSAVGDPAQLSSWQSDRHWAADNASKVEKFKSALDDARAWMADNDEETREILATFTKLPPEVVANSPLPEFTTETNKQSVEQWDKVMRGVTDFKAKVDYDKLVFRP